MYTFADGARKAESLILDSVGGRGERYLHIEISVLQKACPHKEGWGRVLDLLIQHFWPQLAIWYQCSTHEWPRGWGDFVSGAIHPVGKMPRDILVSC